jgi:teichoic acid ribitol-phosphate primase
MSLLEYYLSALLLRMAYLLCLLFPVRANKVVFASARAETLEGNLKFIHDELLEKRPNSKVVLLLDRYSYDFWGKVVYFLKLLRACYHLATARFFFVDNAYLPVHVGPHRAGTEVIQVWHAGGALKKFGLDTSPPNRVVENRFIHKHYDYVIAGSEAAVGPYSSALRTPASHVLPLGIARTDFFFDEAAMADAAARIRSAHPQLAGRTVVLYAPTFRGYSDEKRPHQALDAKLLRERLGEKYALVHKTHPVFSAELVDQAGYDAVVGTEFDVNELFSVTDVFITDYSSSIFEYALMRKPLVLLVDDLASYTAEPGFYLDFERDMIGEFARSSHEAADIIARGAYDLSRYGAFLAKHCANDDGLASERIVDFLDGR